MVKSRRLDPDHSVDAPSARMRCSASSVDHVAVLVHADVGPDACRIACISIHVPHTR